MTGGLPPLFVELCSVINDKIYVSGVLTALREGSVSCIWMNLRLANASCLI